MPIPAAQANELVKRIHYSGKVVQNSLVHFGVTLNGALLGAMQFGSPIDKRRTIPLVKGTRWRGMLELNRMAFSEALPRNSESRALGFALRAIRKRYPFIEWVLSYADACQCGDGAIYRATGFVLTGIKTNTSMLRMPDGSVVARKTLDNSPTKGSSYWRARGATPLPGYQIRYIYFLEPKARKRLAVPELPYSAIADAGIGMYRGEKITRTKHSSDAAASQAAEGGATPTRALQPEKD